MDKITLLKAAQALGWEASYRKRFEQENAVYTRFLADEEAMDPDFERFFDNNCPAGCTVLDVGTGTGGQAIQLAKKGFKVTATDASATAIQYASGQALLQNAPVNFIQDNILLTGLTRQFDIIMDRGCYTLIPRKNSLEYLSVIQKLLKPNGWFLIKADCNKIKKIKILQENTSLLIQYMENTHYTSLNQKKVPAIFFVMRHIHL